MTQVLAGSQEEIVEMLKSEFSPQTYSWAHMADGSFEFKPGNRYSAKAEFRFTPSGDGETEVEMSATQVNTEEVLRKWEEAVLARVSEKLRLARLAAERTFPEAAVPGPDGRGGSEDAAQRQRKPSFKSDVDKPGLNRSPRPDDIAVVVGIEKYQIVPAADFGERDAATFRD